MSDDKDLPPSGTTHRGGPQISVIVPSYNKPEYLPECLRSIQNQTFTDWECIVVSDGSPRVEEIRAAVASMNDARFRLVEHEENRGLAAARNTGIREARADKVICVDEDDQIAEECLQTLLTYMEQASADVVCPQGRLFAGREGPRRCSQPTLAQILVSQPLLPAGSLIRKSVFVKVGFYDEHPVIKKGREDHEWWIRVIAAKVAVLVVNEELYHVRRPVSRDEWNQSLDFLASRHDYEIYQYIVTKHGSLYEMCPEARRIVLAISVESRANWFANNGSYVSSAIDRWRALFLYPSGKRVKKALKATLIALLSLCGMVEFVRGHVRRVRGLA